MGDVVVGSFQTRLDIPVERIIQGAMVHPLQSLVVIGETEDGELYFASSLGKFSATLWLIELAKKTLMESE